MRGTNAHSAVKHAVNSKSSDPPKIPITMYRLVPQRKRVILQFKRGVNN